MVLIFHYNDTNGVLTRFNIDNFGLAAIAMHGINEFCNKYLSVANKNDYIK